MIKKNEIYNEDCLIGMKKIEDKTVDLICTDLPYGQTARNKWDVVIPFNLLWKQYEHIIKDRGAIILFGTVVKGFGSENRTTTFFLTKDKKVGAQCGCFYGTLEEFRRKVKETHKDTQFAKEYLMIADLMELHFIPLVDHLVIEE